MNDDYFANEIKNKLYNEELDYNELLDNKKQLLTMNNYKYKNIIKDIDELLCEQYDEMTLDKLLTLKNEIIEMDLDTSDVDKFIKRKDKLTVEIIDEMNKDDIEYLIYERELELEELLMIKKVAKKVNLSESDKDYVNEMINEYTSDLESEDEVKKTLELFKKYDLSNSYITRKARKLSIDIDEDENKNKNFIVQKKYNSNSVYGEILASDVDNFILNFPNE